LLPPPRIDLVHRSAAPDAGDRQALPFCRSGSKAGYQSIQERGGKPVKASLIFVWMCPEKTPCKTIGYELVGVPFNEK
jgi:hypothetical protein